MNINVDNIPIYESEEEELVDRIERLRRPRRFLERYKDVPGHPLKCTFEGTLKDLLIFSKPKPARKIFYQQLNIRVNELENKKQFKCVWVGSKFKEEKELILYPNKGGSVADLLEEAKKQVEFTDGSSGKLRLVEINCNKVIVGPKEDISLESLTVGGTKVYRVEEIPIDELRILDDEMLIPCAHFYKEVFSTFGIPFLTKIKQGEPFFKVKDRLQKKLGVQDKEWEKYKFAIVAVGKAQFITDDEYNINLQDFKQLPNNSTTPRPWLGLEHMNKAPKRSRFNYLEKAIKIYN